MSNNITQVRVGSNLIGLKGLEEIFQAFSEQAWETEEQAQEELCRLVAAVNYIPAGARPAYRLALWREFRRFRGEEVGLPTLEGLEVKVLGLGCAGCRHFYQQVVDILAAKKIEAAIQYITEPNLLKDYQVRAFPALIINDRLVLEGRLPPPAELSNILMEACNRAT
jgi:hypothetical protein